MHCEVVKEHLDSGSRPVHCNSGILSANQQGYLPGYGVLSLIYCYCASRRYWVECDSEKGNWFVLIMKSGTKKVFELSESILTHLPK